MAGKMLRHSASMLQKTLTKKTKATTAITQIATISTGNDKSVHYSKSSKGSSSSGSGADSDLNERTKRMLEDTVAKIEQQLKDLDHGMHSKLNEAEQKLGAQGFFDKLRNRVQTELKRSHEKISKSPDDIVKDVFNLACHSDKLDMGKLGKMKSSDSGDWTKSMNEVTKSLGFGNDTLQVEIGDIPDYVNKALESPNPNTYALDLSYALSGFKPDEIKAKLHGHLIEIEAHRKSDNTVRDAVMEFTVPNTVDVESLKVYHCGRKHRTIVFASAKDGTKSSGGKDDPSWRTPKDPMF